MKKLPLSCTLILLFPFAFLPACAPQQVAAAQSDPQATMARLLSTLEARMTPAGPAGVTQTRLPTQLLLAHGKDFAPLAADISRASATPAAASPTAPASHTATVSPTTTSVPTETATSTATLAPVRKPTHTPTPTEEITRLPPEAWREWPVIPELSQRAVDQYKDGKEQGVYANVFSIVGDCLSLPWLFLGRYDLDQYSLNEGDAYLQETIDFYAGSFNYFGPSMIDGLNVSSALSPDWANRSVCLAGESPVECELRLRRPAIVLVNLGTNWGASSIERYEHYLRQIVDIILDHGALPVLGTIADNVEGNHDANPGRARVDEAIARVAYDYELPLWNFWLAAQALPYGGLDVYRDGIHLTLEGANLYSFSALQMLDSLRQSLEDGE
ncbi:MAG TPA: SGNH/GDSL hydrolase family protein [Levilinea sp.]|nr:SGNH/GDSL hydrolase family protein [Levilinea sp.]